MPPTEPQFPCGSAQPYLTQVGAAGGWGGVCATREYWIIYRGPRFLAVVWFGSLPTHFPLLPWSSCLSFSVFLCVTSLSSLLTGERGWASSQIIGREKAWPSINRAVLSGCYLLFLVGLYSSMKSCHTRAYLGVQYLHRTVCLSCSNVGCRRITN